MTLTKKAAAAVVAGNPLIPIHDEIMRAEMDRRELRITGPIDSDTAHLIQVKLGYLVDRSEDPITIYLNTPGGSVVDGLAIYDAIMAVRDKGIKVTVRAVGSCMSMGVIIMQAGSVREATEHSAFLLHELSMLTAGSLGRLTDQHKEAERLQSMLNGILQGRTGLSDNKLKELIERRDLYLSAQDAKKHKIIDKVV